DALAAAVVLRGGGAPGRNPAEERNGRGVGAEGAGGTRPYIKADWGKRDSAGGRGGKQEAEAVVDWDATAASSASSSTNSPRTPGGGGTQAPPAPAPVPVPRARAGWSFSTMEREEEGLPLPGIAVDDGWPMDARGRVRG
ncbi:unnamed protein product, partial [Discosporangium mesarthrocarpum]